MIFSLCLQQCIDCVLNFPLNKRQCLVQTKQDGYAIKSHDSLRQKASVFFFSFKVAEATFCVRGEKQNVQLETLSVYRRHL